MRSGNFWETRALSSAFSSVQVLPSTDLEYWSRTWLIARLWLGGLQESNAPEHRLLLWQRFWETYFRRYGELRPHNLKELVQWQVVAATTSLAWDRNIASTDQRVSFVRAALDGAAHPWLSGV